LIHRRHRAEVGLRRIESTEQLAPAVLLAREYGVGFAATDAYEGREFEDVPGAAEIQTFMALDIGES
jgi:hypothetical protein